MFVIPKTIVAGMVSAIAKLLASVSPFTWTNIVSTTTLTLPETGVPKEGEVVPAATRVNEVYQAVITAKSMESAVSVVPGMATARLASRFWI